MVSVDIFTTGPDVGRDNLIGVCLLPLDSFYNVYKQNLSNFEEIKNGRIIRPFDIEISPNRKENIHLPDRSWMKSLPKGVNRNRILSSEMHGVESFKAADYFDGWFQKLRLPFRKKLCVISHNWIDKRPFLIDWLGTETYNQIFANTYRDIVTASLFANDRADLKNNALLYPKNFLTYLCSSMKIEYHRGQDLISNCVCIAECYKNMLSTPESPF